MALSEIDRRLLDQCLDRDARSWEHFVDRFLGLVIHVINHASQERSRQIANEDREDLVSEVFLTLIRDDFLALRRFRGESSLATYLTVISRRVVVRQLSQHKPPATLQSVRDALLTEPTDGSASEQRIDDREELQRLLRQLNGAEAEVVRMYHLEGKSYREISVQVGMPENSIGPTLSRARSKMREASADSTT